MTSWAIIAPSGFVETTSVNEELQRGQVANENSPYCGYRVVKLTGTYQRVKPQSVECFARVMFCDNGAHGYSTIADVAGKTGIFTWQEAS